MTWQEIENLSDHLATKSIECFNRLPKAGKPTQHGSKKSEWTVLACILQVYASKYYYLSKLPYPVFSPFFIFFRSYSPNPPKKKNNNQIYV